MTPATPAISDNGASARIPQQSGSNQERRVMGISTPSDGSTSQRISSNITTTPHSKDHGDGAQPTLSLPDHRRADVGKGRNPIK
jgi:hypothetical protein